VPKVTETSLRESRDLLFHVDGYAVTSCMKDCMFGYSYIE
jgi:hypothetical protein